MGAWILTRRERVPLYRALPATLALSRTTMIRMALAACLLLSGRAAHAEASDASVVRAPEVSGRIGLYDATQFRVGKGHDLGAEPKAAFWYFKDEVVGRPASLSFKPVSDDSLDVEADVRQWSRSGDASHPTLPFLVWTGAPAIVDHARLSQDGRSVDLGTGEVAPFAIVPKLPTNRSYFDTSSIAALSTVTLRMRGTRAARDGGAFVARTLWPEGWALDLGKAMPLGRGESLTALIEADDGGARAPYTTRVLWERRPGASAPGPTRAVMGFVLNGAQGDDDEAHGGHFAVFTGRHDGDARMADWMVNNFYNLGTVSEKGIIASMLPMDAYMTDLNSGQAWYRPSYLLVAILDDPAPAQQFQNAIIRVFERFYRQHVAYDHAQANCAGISVDTLSGLGWNYPRLGPTSTPKAVAGYFYSSATDLDFASGRKTFHYLSEERVRLYPRAAFETLGQDLMMLASNTARPITPYEKLLASHVQAIVFVRIPQIPSSRAMGTFPVGSFDAYMARVPADRKDWKIVPVDSRTFPDALRDRPEAQPALSDAAVGWLALSALGLAAAVPLALGRRLLKSPRGTWRH